MTTNIYIALNKETIGKVIAIPFQLLCQLGILYIRVLVIRQLFIWYIIPTFHVSLPHLEFFLFVSWLLSILNVTARDYEETAESKTRSFTYKTAFHLSISGFAYGLGYLAH